MNDRLRSEWVYSQGNDLLGIMRQKETTWARIVSFSFQWANGKVGQDGNRQLCRNAVYTVDMYTRTLFLTKRSEVALQLALGKFWVTTWQSI